MEFEFGTITLVTQLVLRVNPNNSSLLKKVREKNIQQLMKPLNVSILQIVQVFSITEHEGLGFKPRQPKLSRH